MPPRGYKTITIPLMVWEKLEALKNEIGASSLSEALNWALEEIKAMRGISD